MATTTSTQFVELFLESDMQSADCIPVSSGNVTALCRRCPDKEEPNDDSAAVLQTDTGAVVMVVADGVGGCPLGHKASATAVECILESVKSSQPNSDLRPAILDGIERANSQILDLGIGAATTVTVVEINDRVARAYQVGDSMALVIGQRGAIKWKSMPHSPVGYAIESGMLGEADAMHHDERHIVSNLVGSRDMHIEIGPARTLAARDTVVVGSDGLFDNLHLDEIVEFARSGKPLDRMQRLECLATKRMHDPDEEKPGKPDDLTILLYTH
ncbi:MAG: SpoIIE family protein phosphatase [Pirellulaceae bacterium]|nr:SpoIIE family protein phosphatase [Pirellulaceae bacterium]